METFGICLLSTIPVRCKPAERSEMGSQLLFGETYQVIDEQENWVKIQCTWDKYTGWIRNNQLEEIEKNELEEMQEVLAFALETSQPAVGREFYIPILMGSTMPQFDGINFRVKGQRFTYSGQAIQPNNTKPSTQLAVRIARKYLYAPFFWGGRSPFGVDAAGLIQVVYKMMGVKMSRSAAMQAKRGKTIHFVDNAQEGDLAFFENERNKIIHVGMVLAESEIIHAAGRVRVDMLDHYGIFNTETNHYTHKLRLIKRIL
ncbi:MAG: NlpC/P60 family protein [Saprospiraceae bacterium]